MNYNHLSLDELAVQTNEYIRRHWADGGRCEFDHSINDISRAIISRYNEKHGCCFLGKINLCEDNVLPYRLTQYTGQKVLNFMFDFILSCEDDQLAALITEHNRKHDHDQSGDTRRRVEAMIQRIIELDGICLFWA